uniref:SPATA31 domain-containing protein n=1 Tax=Loxodonta africana TaxID=9785 RepID=G3SZJ5_LOXAF
MMPSTFVTCYVQIPPVRCVIEQLLKSVGGAMEHAVPCLSPVASTVPVTESSFTLALSAQPPEDPIPASLPEPSVLPSSILSPDLTTPLINIHSPSLPLDSLPPEPVSSSDSTFPVDCFLPQPFTFSPFPVHPTQRVDPVLQPDPTFSLNTIFSPDPTLSQDINPSPYLSHTMNLTDPFACHCTPAILSASPPPDGTLTVTQSQLTPISLQVVPKSLSPASHSGNLSFLSPDALALLERQVKKRGQFLKLKEKKMKKGTFPDQHWPDYQLNSLEKMFTSISEKHNSEAFVPFWDMEGKPKKLHIHQESPYPKTFGDHVHQQHTQLFCGLPSLHSESLVSTILVSADRSSAFDSFNRISNVSPVQMQDEESPLLSQPLPLSLPEIQPQTLPQSQHLYPPRDQLQAHVQSQCQIRPPSPSQTGICGACFHKPQNEAQSLIQDEIYCLEWHVLQKQLEGLWGVPSVVRRSQEAFCPSAPNFPQRHRPYQACASVSIIPGNFPLSGEVQKVLEHHLRKRLIQHRWGLPRRILESLSLMRPPEESPETSESRSTYGLSWISEFKNRSSMDLKGDGLSHRRSFYERSLEILRLERDMRKDQGHSLENVPKDHLSKDSKSSSVSVLGSDSEKDPKSHRVSLSGNNSRAPGVSLDRKQQENALKTHLSNKLGQIKGGRIPDVVDSSWHSVKKTLPLPEKSHTQMKHRNLAPSVGGYYCLKASQELPFIDSSKKQMLEGHIKSFRRRMIWGLPRKVLESIQMFKSGECPSFPFSYSNLPPSTALISGMDSKIKVSKPLGESPQMFWGDKITNSVPITDCTLPATSPVDKEGQRDLRQSLLDISHELTEDFQIIKNGRKTFVSPNHRNTDKINQSKTVIPNRHSPEQPTSQTGTGHTPRDKSTSSRDTAGMLQDKGMVDKNLKHVSMASVSREIFKAKELLTFQSQSSKVKTKSPQLPRIPVLQDPDPSYLKRQLISELKFTLEVKQNSQAQDSSTDTSCASDSLTPTDSLWNDSPTAAQSVPSGYMAAPQVLYAHVEDKRISMEQQQESWIPKQVLGECHDKNFPPAAEELEGGEAGLETSQTRRKSYPAHHKTFVEITGSRSSQSLSQNGQSPPESNFRKKMKKLFLQWLHPRKFKRQEISLEKGSSMPAS